ncbi:Protein of unknown function [Asanoa ishikariensis]|uniref:DUF2752 domain-containing protein n=2 Tax=Asanoa ishikariensis TaxID=137265 RepID=A0A1H3RMX9_9ACTN|nr:Protein of unknown function [Asanoa ishikariensis]
MTPAPGPAAPQASPEAETATTEDSSIPGAPIAGGADAVPEGGNDPSAMPGPDYSVGYAAYGGPDGAVPPTFLPPSYAPPRRGRVGRAYLRMLERVPRWLAPLAVLGCIGGAVGYTLISNPTDSAPDAPPTCILKLTTGLDCPGCGGTRAAWYLLHGDVAAAARHHLVFVFAVPFIIYLYIAWAAQRAFGRKLPQLKIPPVAIAIFMGAWLAFSILRNLPWAPFNWFYV